MPISDKRRRNIIHKRIIQKKKKVKLNDVTDEKKALEIVNKLPEDLTPVIWSFIPEKISTHLKYKKYIDFLKKYNCLRKESKIKTPKFSIHCHTLGIMLNKLSYENLCKFVEYGSISNYYAQFYPHRSLTIIQEAKKIYNIYTHKMEYTYPAREWVICSTIKILLENACKKASYSYQYSDTSQSQCDEIVFACNLLRNIVYVCHRFPETLEKNQPITKI